MTTPLADDVLTHGIHRFLADGVHYRDLQDIQAAISDWSDWCRVWSDFAAAAESRGETAREAGRRATAADELVRAAIYYHYAQNVFYVDPAAKRVAQERKVAVFRRAAALLDPPLERVEIPFDAIRMPAYLRCPPDVVRPPCAILLGGLDTTKEDYIGVSNLCVQRGLATLAFDGPGQGETLSQSRWRPDFDRAIHAVLDDLGRRPEIDAGRIGIIGRSMGGFYGPKAAATDPRIKAVVAWGAMYALRNLRAVPRLIQDGLMFVSGATTVEEAEEFFRTVNLEGIAPRIRCPLLIVHGGLDTITPMENATRLAAEAGGVVETLMWSDSIHCCHDRSHIVRPAMADFLARYL